MNHFIGGNNLSQFERLPYLRRMRTKGRMIQIPPYKNESWKIQCNCGNFNIYYSYRGRIYCKCGRRVDVPGYIEKMKDNSRIFSKGFVEHLENFLNREGATND